MLGTVKASNAAFLGPLCAKLGEPVNIQCAHDELVDLVRLQPNPRNPNKHPKRQIDMLAKIISYQGQRAPIVVSKRSGFIVKGHGRLEAIKLLAWEKAAVDFQDYEDEAQEFADMVADNKIAELAEHDDEMMKAGVLELNLDQGFDFELLGLSTDLNLSGDLIDPIEHEGLDKVQIVILECPHCQETFEKSQAKIVG